jgi:hypothetical protein
MLKSLPVEKFRRKFGNEYNMNEQNILQSRTKNGQKKILPQKLLINTFLSKRDGLLFFNFRAQL